VGLQKAAQNKLFLLEFQALGHFFSLQLIICALDSHFSVHYKFN